MQKTKFSAVAATFLVCVVFWVLLDFSFKAEEVLALRFGVIHNLWYYNHLMEEIRRALETGTFEEFRREFYRKREKD